MGWGKVKKYAKRAGGKTRKAFKSAGGKVKGWTKRAGTAFYKGLENPTVQAVLTGINPVLGAAAAGVTAHRNKGEGDFEMDEEGLRSTAAKRLVDTQRQAGGGQIKFTTEEYE